MKDQLQALIGQALQKLPEPIREHSDSISSIEIERTRDPAHGDFACNIAMRLAKPCRMNPRELATQIVESLPESVLIEKTEIAGPGFINIYLAASAYHAQIGEIIEKGERFGHQERNGQKVLVEYISANPTGPLHVGHGRLAAYGACVSNLLDAAGFDVSREYYVNDAGRQMAILGLSVWLRYLEANGTDIHFPVNGYRGEYISEIAQLLKKECSDEFVRVDDGFWDKLDDGANALPDSATQAEREANKKKTDLHVDTLIARAKESLGEDDFRQVLDFGLRRILDDIREDLHEFGVDFDCWYSERTLHEGGEIDIAIELLKKNKTVFEKDGAQWFRATDFGDEKDRVVVRDNGQKTYFASDIAYHHHKRERGNDLLLDILGSDHHGYVARVRAGLEAMGEPAESLEVRLVQFVTLYRGGEKMQMSTRSGEFVTLRQLRKEVGNDAARFFYVMRSNDQHLDFDLELAKSRSNDNPVYYVQYAHARVCSVMRELREKGFDGWDRAQGIANLPLLKKPHEQTLLVALSRYPETLALSAQNRAPHTLAHYLRDLASDFQSNYQQKPNKVLVEDDALRNARLTLFQATGQILRNGLAMLGVSAPESM